MVFDGKLDHVISRIPVSGHILGHHVWLKRKGVKNLIPSRKDNGRGIFHGQGNASKLFKQQKEVFLKEEFEFTYLCQHESDWFHTVLKAC